MINWNHMSISKNIRYNIINTPSTTIKSITILNHASALPIIVKPDSVMIYYHAHVRRIFTSNRISHITTEHESLILAHITHNYYIGFASHDNAISNFIYNSNTYNVVYY